jgi:hypothetical protein
LQQEQTNDLLKLLLPEFIHEKMEEAEEIQQDEGEVAVIFIEICKFDQILKSKHRQIITFLDDIFRGFDRLCLEYGIQKIEVSLFKIILTRPWEKCTWAALDFAHSKEILNSPLKESSSIRTLAPLAWTSPWQ